MFKCCPSGNTVQTKIHHVAFWMQSGDPLHPWRPLSTEGDSVGSFWLGLNLRGDHREQGILLAPDPSLGTPGSCLSFFLAFRNAQKSLCKGSRLIFQNVHSANEKRRGRSLMHTCKESAAVERTWMCPPLASPRCWLPAAWS